MAEPQGLAEEVAQAYEDALDDVHTRFLLNLPPEELATADRIFFQLEQAWWFYDDFHCDNSLLALPRFKGLKPFALRMFQMSPLLSIDKFDKMWEEYSAYKRRISNYGTILVNASCTKMILCKVWQSNSWTFPAGKVNQYERGVDSGARETYEETGFDPNCCFGLTKKMLENGEKLTWRPLQEEDALVVMDSGSGKRRTMYICKGVPEDFPFAPVARKEVSSVEWHSIDEVPKKSFAVLPFLKQLRRWIKKNKKEEKQAAVGKQTNSTKNARGRNANSCGRDSRGRDSRGRDSRGRDSRGRDSRGKVREDDPLTETGLASAGECGRWTEKDMFNTNEKILGRKVEYDGNPHYFAEKGFDGRDPHAFRVVGGTFMNSGGIASLAPPPDQSKLQPLFRKDGGSTDGQLMPFFSEKGETPWGEVVPPAVGSAPIQSSWQGDVFKRPLGTLETKSLQYGVQNVGERSILLSSHELDLAFMTDTEITARSQVEKIATSQQTINAATNQLNQAPLSAEGTNARHKKHTENLIEIGAWLTELIEAGKGRHKVSFKFDTDSILDAMTAAMG